MALLSLSVKGILNKISGCASRTASERKVYQLQRDDDLTFSF